VSSAASDRTARTAADAAVKAVSVQLSGETEKSRAEFLREQRRILYSTIIADEIRLHKAEQKGFSDMYKDQQRKRKRTKQANSKLTSGVAEKFEKLEQDQTSAEVIASPTTRSRSAALVEVHNKLTNHVTFWSYGGKVSSANLRNLAEWKASETQPLMPSVELRAPTWDRSSIGHRGRALDFF